MSFQEKNIVVSLVNFILILVYFLFRLFQINQTGTFNETNIFRLWGIVIVLAIFVTVASIVITQLVSAIIHARKTGAEKPEINDFKDERDKLIDLRGTSLTYKITSLGSFIAMLTFTFGQPPLVMFTLIIFFGVSGQIVGDIARLVLYQRGF